MDKPQNIYDNEKFYKDYRDMREKGLNANELIEIPIMKEMLPDLNGKRILDLGCGNGGMSKYFISILKPLYHHKAKKTRWIILSVLKNRKGKEFQVFLAFGFIVF